MKALAARDAQQAKAVADDIAWAVEPHHVVTGSQEVFASYNIQLEKILMGASGYCKLSPTRPPYNQNMMPGMITNASHSVKSIKRKAPWQAPLCSTAP